MVSFVKRGIKNVGYLFVGNMVSMVIRSLAVIYIARELGPEGWGLYATAGAFIGIFAFIKMDGINKAIIKDNCQHPKKMRRNLENAMGLKHFFALLAILVVLVVTIFIPKYEIKLKLYIGILSFQLFLNSTRSLLNTVYQVEEDMKYISIFNIVQSILFAIIAPIFIYLGYGVLVLIFINLATNLIGLILNFIKTKKFVTFKFWNRVRWDKKLVKASFTFSLISIVIAISTKVDQVMISFMGNPTEVGIYAAAIFFVSQGGMIRNIISTAFFPIIMKRMKHGAVKLRILLKYSVIFFVVIMLGASVISFFSQDIVNLFFGDDFARSGVILGVLIFALANGFAGLPFWNTLIAIDKERSVLITAIIQAVANIPMNIVMYHYFGLVGISISTLIVGTLQLMALVFLTYHALKKQNRLT